MKNFTFFTIDDVRKINQHMIDKKNNDSYGLTPVSKTLIQETKFTTQQINSAFARAKKNLEAV